MGFLDSIFGTAQAAQMQDPYSGLELPSISDQELQYQLLQNQGQLTPELQQLINLGPSAMEGVSTDPRLKQAQFAALSKLMQVGESGGMTLQDQATLNKTMTQVGQAERGSREAIMSSAARRGTSGSGFELAAQLANQQGSADRAADAGLQT